MLHQCIVEETPGLIRVHDPVYDFKFEIWGSAPVQASGEFAGREFYFRARHDAWSCEVSDSRGQLPSDGQADSDGFIREGEYANASYMPLRKALTIIGVCIREYIAMRSQQT